MKIAGKKISGVNYELVVIPRPKLVDVDENGNPVEKSQDIVFKAQAVLDFGDFEKLCPPPQPPMSRRPNGETFLNTETKSYKEAMSLWSLRRIQWMTLESLKATPDLEWETIKADDPMTWGNVDSEMVAAGLNWREVDLIRQAVWKANSLDDEKIEEAKKNFLSSEAAAAKRQS